MRPDGSAIRKTEIPTPCLSVFLTGRADICDEATNSSRESIFVMGQHSESRGREDIWEKTENR